MIAGETPHPVMTLEPAAPWTTDLASLAREVPAPFAEERLTSYGQALEQTLLTGRTSVQRCTQVDLKKVRGVSHPTFGDFSWVQALQEGKRSELNLELLRYNPGYYLSEVPKDIFFTALGDDVYVSGGVHRAVIARFFYHHNQHMLEGRSWLAGVRLEQHEVDTEAQDLVERVRSLLAAQAPDHLTFRVFHDSLREEGRHRFVLRDRHSGWYRQFSRDELLELIDTLAQPRRGLRPRKARAWNIFSSFQRA